MLKNFKNMPGCHYEINDEKWQKMTENDTINDWKWDRWLKQNQKNWKIVERTWIDRKWQSVIMRENDKKWQIMTQKGP